MTQSRFLQGVVEILGPNTVRINGVGKPKEVMLPSEVVSWIKDNYPVYRILEELVTHYKFRARLSNPGSFKSLLLLLYARAKGIAPYRIARQYGVAPEQLYRMERGLKKDNLYDFVINLLSIRAAK